MARVQRSPLVEQAARVLLDRIRGGEWEIGATLPGETSLAEQLDVGRSTVRESIRLLAGQGLLASRQGAGVFVLARDVTENWESILQRSGIRAVIEARIAIESEAAALAAERRSADELGELRQLVADRALARRDIHLHVDADTAFHRGIVRASHSPLLLELFDSFTPQLRAAMISMLEMRGEFGSDHDQDAHEELLAVIEQSDAARAAQLSRAHLQAPASDLG